MSLAFAIRPFDHWGWTLVGGITSLILGTLILSISPQAPWILGILVGVDLLMAGAIFIGLSLKIKKSDKAETI